MKTYRIFKKMLLFSNPYTRGIRIKINHKIEKNFTLFDNEINYIVQIRLFSEPYLAGFFIKVSTLNGTVSLDGYVDTLAQAELAINIAKSVTGVKYVVSRIMIRSNSNANK